MSLLRSTGELPEGGEQLDGEASPRASEPVMSQLHGSQTEPMTVSSGITTQHEGLQSHTASRGKVHDDEVQVSMTASAAKLDFQTFYGNISVEQVSREVVPMQNVKDKQKGVCG